MEQQYGVRPKTLQGGAKDMKEINDWVAQETGGKVQRLLSKPLPRNTGVNTVSGAYFKGTSNAPKSSVQLSVDWEGNARSLVHRFARSRLRVSVCEQGSG